MLKKILFSVSLLLFPLVVLAADQAPKRMIWKGDPLRVPLSQNVEQRITFPDAKIIWADLPNQLKGKLVTQIVANDVYWTAKEPFDRIRITLGEEGSDKVFLMDVSASSKKVITPRIVVMMGSDPYSSIPEPPKTIKSTVDNVRASSSSPVAGYATLLRFASAEVYAPQRLRMKGTGIVKVSISPASVHSLLPQHTLMISTAAAWRSNNLYVTALEVVNKSAQNVMLDPREIRGVWKAALFQQNILRSHGGRDDNTTLFLVSDKPFTDAIISHPMIQLRN